MTTLAIQTQGTPAHLRSRAFLKIPFLNQNFTYLAFWGQWFRQSRDLFPDFGDSCSLGCSSYQLNNQVQTLLFIVPASKECVVLSFINQALRGALAPPAAARMPLPSFLFIVVVVVVFKCCVVNRLKILRILRRETRLKGSTQILRNSNVARS